MTVEVWPADRRIDVSVTGPPSPVVQVSQVGRQQVSVSAGNRLSVEVSRPPKPDVIGVVGIPGPAGRQGDPGKPGTGAGLEVNFRYGDATPEILATVPAGTLILGVRVYIDDGFDGVGPSLSVGDAADHESLVPVVGIDPASIGVYEAVCGVTYETDTQVLLFINQGSGATAGGGTVVLYF